MKTITIALALLAGAVWAQDFNYSVKVDSNGVLRTPTNFIPANGIATTGAVNASNAVQDIAIALRATISQLAATSAADRAYADGLTDPNALTNGVGSGCTVTSTGKTFYVYVVAPTGTAASVDVDLQDHKTNATAHAELFGAIPADDTSWRASTQTWNTVTAKLDASATNGAEWGSHALLVTNTDSRLTDNRTDGAAVHTGDVAYVSTVSNAATAWQNPTNASDFVWVSNGKEITITSYVGAGGAVVIPDMLDGLPVTALGVQSFYYNTDITSVTAGINLEHLNGGVFEGCSSLSSVDMQLITAGNVGGGGGVTSYNFWGCSSLSSVKLGTRLLNIGYGMFEGCSSLSSITIPPTVTIIKSYAFKGTALSTVAVPKSVTSIEDLAFENVSTLGSVFFEGNAPSFIDDMYKGAPSVVNYVLSPTATGWGDMFPSTGADQRPVVRLPLYGSSSNLTGYPQGAMPNDRTLTINGVTSNLNDNPVYSVGTLTNEPVLIAQNTATLDPTGWQNQDAITVNYTPSNTVILSSASGLTNWWRGVAYGRPSPWESVASPTTNSVYFLAFRDNPTNAIWSTTQWSFDMGQIATVNIGPNWTLATRETHGMGMSHETHASLHYNVGTYRLSGLTAWGYTLNSDTATAKTPGINAGVIEDEDLETTISGVSTGGPYTHLMILSTNTSIMVTNQTTITRTGTGAYGMYNPKTAGVFATNTEMVASRFINYYVLHLPACAGANCQTYRTVILQPQVQYTSLALAQAEDFRSLDLGDLPTLQPEFVPYARLTFDTNGGYTQTPLKQRLQAVSYVVGSKATTVNVSGTFAASVGAVVNDGSPAGVASLTAGTLTIGTNIVSGGIWTPPSLLPFVSANTCLLTRAMIETNAWWSIIPTGTVYFAADSTLTDTNIGAVFAIDLFYNGQTFRFVGDSITNTKTLTSNLVNGIFFDKPSMGTLFTGR